MKTNIRYTFFAIAILALSLSACERFDDLRDIEAMAPVSIALSITIPGPEHFDPIDNPQPTTISVHLDNFAEQAFSREFELTLGDNSTFTVFIDSLVPGTYSIRASVETVTGNIVGNATNVPIVLPNTQLNIDTRIIPFGRLIFKQIFYAGRTLSYPGTGTYFREGFFEVYNNSDEIIYLDSVAFAILNPMNATANLPTWPEEDGERYVYAHNHVFQIPGSGTCFPLQPGESVILAQRAIDHPAFMPGSVLNLLGAEFEFHIPNANLPVNPNVINAILVYNNNDGGGIGLQWLLPMAGPALVMFRQEGPIDPSFTSASAQVPAHQRLRIRRDDVLDAVEAVPNAAAIMNKRVPLELDAGAVTVGGVNVGLAVSRIVRTTRPDGTPILWDTNNSSRDFEVVTPEPRRNGSRPPALWDRDAWVAANQQ